MLASGNDLQYFLELAKTLNFSRAAERIGISQPSLSAAIKRLEHAVGIELFIRNKHNVSLTHAGKKLLTHALELQQLWNNTKSACLASHEEVQGNIAFGCHPSVAMYFLPKFLPELLKKYPKLEIELRHDLSRKIAEQVINLNIDIGIAVNPAKNPNLVIKKLFEDEFAIWHAAKKSEMHLQDEATIICDPDLLQVQYILKNLSKLGVKQYRIIASSSLELIANLTAEGAGFGILPGLVVQTIAPEKLQKFSQSPTYLDEICLIYRHENRNVQAVKVISEAIRSLTL